MAVLLKPPPQSDLAQSLAFRQKIARIDIVGAFLLITAFTCLLLAMQWGGTTYAWTDSRVWGCLLGFALIIGAFVAVQIGLEEWLILAHYPDIP